MKGLVVSALFSASAVHAALIPPKINYTQAIDWKLEQKRQALGALTWLVGKGGRVADPAGAAPRKVMLQSDSKIPGTKRIKIRYGPYQVPNMAKTGINGEAGSLWNYPDTNIDKPCIECTIVSQWAGLEYPNGDNANIDSGMWLHHMVHFTKGPGRWDPTCTGFPSMPHADVGASASNSERYFSSGNERTKVRIDNAGADTKAGYHIKASDKFAFIVDLMNMNMEDKVVYLTMTYDIIDGPLPTGWKDMKIVWFDSAQCGTSEVRPPQQSGRFTVPTRPWTPNFEGDIIGVGTHLHDGGTSVDILSGNSKPVCDSVAKYGETPEYIFKATQRMGAGANYAERHISSQSSCYNEELGQRKLEKTQSWQLKCNYDYEKYQGNKGPDGKQADIMCISLMYVAVPAVGVTPVVGGGARSRSG